MSIRLLFLLIPLVLLSACNSVNEPTPMSTKANSVDAETLAQESFQSLESDYANWREELAMLLDAAKGKDEEQEVLHTYNAGFNVLPERSMAIYEKYPETVYGFKALEWTSFKASGDLYVKAINTLLKNHIESEQLEFLPLRMIGRKVGNHVEESLERLIADSPHDSVKGAATLALGKYMVRVLAFKRDLSESEELADKEVHDYIMNCKFETKEISKLFQTVIDNYPNFKAYKGSKLTLGGMAQGSLFEFNNLSVGQVAPDIEGDDLKGESFKLSDYRGEVIVIDFWGDW